MLPTFTPCATSWRLCKVPARAEQHQGPGEQAVITSKAARTAAKEATEVAKVAVGIVGEVKTKVPAEGTLRL